MPQMIPVESSNIVAIGYESLGATLFVQFKSGRTYAVADIAPGEYDAFMSAPSKGSFYANNIKDQYKVRPV